MSTRKTNEELAKQVEEHLTAKSRRVEMISEAIQELTNSDSFSLVVIQGNDVTVTSMGDYETLSIGHRAAIDSMTTPVTSVGDLSIWVQQQVK